MVFWQLIDGLIRNPPLWILVVIVALLVAHVISHIARTVDSLSADKRLFEVLEIVIVVVLTTLIFKLAFFESIEGGSVLHEWYKDWPSMLVLLLIFTFASLAAYVKLIK